MGNYSLLLTNSVEFLAASLLSSAWTSHIVHLALKMITMASHAAEITAGMEINYKRIDNVECIHGSCMQLFIVHGRIISILLVTFQITSYIATWQLLLPFGL